MSLVETDDHRIRAGLLLRDALESCRERKLPGEMLYFRRVVSLLKSCIVCYWTFFLILTPSDKRSWNKNNTLATEGLARSTQMSSMECAIIVTLGFDGVQAMR